MRPSLRQQYKLSLGRQFRKASQQFQDENLCTAIFSAGQNRREIHGNGAKLMVTLVVCFHLLFPMA